ncbi:MAG: hypothetical protein GF329_13965 [Candidatus Lokiarchaeota archaeon]|nr:hypothetical protein [Candidatus Lokiarchaeota archaeon]
MIMYKSIESLKEDKAKELKQLKDHIDNFLKIKGLDFFALLTTNGLIIEKFEKKEIDQRVLWAIITKILNICNWGISKVPDLREDESVSDIIEIVFRAGIIIIKQIGDGFIIFLLLKRITDKNKLYLELNSLSYQINSLLGDTDKPQISNKIDNEIEKLKSYIDEMNAPKLSEIKKMLKYIVD